MTSSLIKVGTRGSALALAQTGFIVARLQQIHPKFRFKTVVIKTSGDRIRSAADLRKAGKGVFVKEIERALLARKIDLAVHSLKDMPSEITAGLSLGAIPEREEAADAFLGRTDTPIEKLEPHSVIGTSSLRRQALLNATFKHLDFEDLRGNLDTRLAQLRAPRSKWAGIVVAAAGLRRLYREATPPHVLLDKDVIVPAAGQGALALQIRAKDAALGKLLAPLHHEETAAAVTAERALLRRLEGGCQVPLGAYARAGDDGFLKLVASLAMPDGTRRIREEATGTIEDPEGVAAALEMLMRNSGATAILASFAPRRSPARPGRNGHKPRRAGRPKKSRGRG